MPHEQGKQSATWTIIRQQRSLMAESWGQGFPAKPGSESGTRKIGRLSRSEKFTYPHAPILPLYQKWYGLEKKVPRVKPIKKFHATDFKGTKQILFWIWWLNWCVCVLVAQLCTTLCDSMDCSLPGSSVHGILQARTLEWVAFPFSRGSSRLRDQTQVSCTAGRFFSIWAIQLGFCLNRKVVPDQLVLLDSSVGTWTTSKINLFFLIGDS